MEANIFKRRLEEAKNNSEYIKIIFQYPASERAIIKRGYVLEVMDNGFNLQEDRDGEVSYAFDYIVEIKVEVKNDTH